MSLLLGICGALQERGPLARLQEPPGNESWRRGRSLVHHEVDLAQDVPHDQVAIAVSVSVKGEGRRGPTHLDRLALGILDRCAGGEQAFPQATKPEDLTRRGAGEDVELSVLVQVHQLWSEPDASPRRDGAARTARLEPLVALETRTGIRAQVVVDPQLPLVELAHEQVVDSVAIDVAIERCRVADELNINRLTPCVNLHGWGQVTAATRRRGHQRPQYGRESNQRCSHRSTHLSPADAPGFPVRSQIIADVVETGRQASSVESETQAPGTRRRHLMLQYLGTFGNAKEVHLATVPPDEMASGQSAREEATA